jgi:DNA polymerase-3 subunit gamma/tau
MPEAPLSEPGRSLYRRHRPRTFADVVGQDAVVRTLRNAVSKGRVHHAYLFVGSRGTGKTSMAKILAASLNCEQWPTTEPCGTCESCRSIAAATSLDVIEMDAASSNSVEDIRELRERIALAPVSGRQKVYILDEAHMLSQAAWNAFLKTLEEPPAATVFVLATTEAQKVPATVVDRCHRFDFHRPGAGQIAEVVRRVAQAEGAEVPPEAIAAIARAAQGSFRDALGTLEQLLTYSGEQVELGDVLALLGATENELLAQLLDAARAEDAARALTLVAQCAERGRDPAMLAGDIEARCREALIAKTLGAVPRELSLTAESDARLMEQAERLDRALLVRLLELLGAAREAARAGADARTQLELAFVKAACPELEGDAGTLLGRIERLEQRLELEPGRAARTDAAHPGATEPADAAHPGSTGSGDASHSRSGQQRARTHARAVHPQTEHHDERVAQTEGDPPAARVPAADSAGEAPVGGTPPEDPARAGAPAETPDGVQAEAPAADGSAEQREGELEAVRACWGEAIEAIRGRNALLGAVLADAKPVDAQGGVITLAFASSASFFKRKAEDRAHVRTVSEALEQVMGRRVRVRYELSEGMGVDGHTPDEEELIARLVAELDAEELPAAEEH